MNKAPILLLCLLLTTSSAAETLPQNDPYRHLGVQSCAASSCHGAVAERDTYSVLQNEYLTWARHDMHARAYQVLLDERSQRIARNLGIDAAHQSAQCLNCHSDYVPESRRGLQYQLSDGVSCEACHGGAEQWLGVHISGAGASHAENVAAGMYPTADPVARASLCLSCHMGTRDKFASHQLMGAGHPRLAFDLQKFTELMPRHHRADSDYRQRKAYVSDDRVWAIGQVAASLYYLDLLQSDLLAGGVFPELGLFNCHGCHQSMQQPQWSPSERSRTAPGTVLVNDSALLMTQLIAQALRQPEHEVLIQGVRELHQASQRSIADLAAAAERLQTPLRSLLEGLSSRTFGESDQRALQTTLIDAIASGKLHDYAEAEQATMALDVLCCNEVNVRRELDRLYDVLADEDRFSVAAVSGVYAANVIAVPRPSNAGQSMVVDANTLRVRRAPDTASAIVTRLSAGAVVDVLRSDGDWSQVRFSHGGAVGEGWVASRFLRPQID